MDDKIVLDRKSFEALAVDTRVRILKSLKQRRKTLSEIAEEQKMSVSGIKEHLSVLERVGLIEKFDDGHKWKYYELTKKGNEIIGPKEIRVWILLSMSTFALIASMFWIFSASLPLTQSMAGETSMPMAETPPAGEHVMAIYKDAGDGVPEAAVVSHEESAATQPLANETAQAMEAGTDFGVPVAVASISALVILACLGMLARNRLRTSP